MSLRTFFHDLAVRFVVLGWIFAQKPRKWAPKGHNFQPHPPVQPAPRDLLLLLSLGGSLLILTAACTSRSLSQYLLWRSTRMS